jgi:hypothetical protein
MPFRPSEEGEPEGQRGSDLQFYLRSIADVGVRWLELMSKNMSKLGEALTGGASMPVGTLSDMAQTAEVHVKVGPDGSLSVSAPQLADAGIHAGDAVVVVPERRRRVRSIFGVHDRGTDFGVEDQRAIRAEMAAGLGEDLTR